jgi:hypothetical protein
MTVRNVVVGADVDGPQPQPVWHAARKEWGMVACYLDSDTAEVVFDGTVIAVAVSVDQLHTWDEVVT